MSKVLVEEGQSVNLVVYVSALGAVIKQSNVRWLKNETVISSGLFDNNRRLTIRNAQQFDAGIYQVWVSIVGFQMLLRTKNTAITVQVYGKFYQYINLLYAI